MQAKAAPLACCADVFIPPRSSTTGEQDDPKAVFRSLSIFAVSLGLRSAPDPVV